MALYPGSLVHETMGLRSGGSQLMRDSELRGVILEALYNQRRKDLVNLDQELGGLPVPHSATESILRQLVKKGLVERPIQSLNGLGNARITAYGIDVVQGTTRPPLSILLHQRITVQDVSDVTRQDRLVDQSVCHSRRSPIVAAPRSSDRMLGEGRRAGGRDRALCA